MRSGMPNVFLRHHSSRACWPFTRVRISVKEWETCSCNLNCQRMALVQLGGSVPQINRKQIFLARGEGTESYVRISKTSALDSRGQRIGPPVRIDVYQPHDPICIRGIR